MMQPLSECSIVRTPFREFRGVYEYRKAQALAEHLQRLAVIVGNAQSVSLCRKAPERGWIFLQERLSPGAGNREGEWISDIEVEGLR